MDDTRELVVDSSKIDLLIEKPGRWAWIIGLVASVLKQPGAIPGLSILGVFWVGGNTGLGEWLIALSVVSITSISLAAYFVARREYERTPRASTPSGVESDQGLTPQHPGAD